MIEGRLSPVGIAVEVQEDQIRKEMKLHFPRTSAEPMGHEKIEIFMRFFKELAGSLDLSEIKPWGHSADGLVEYGCLEPHATEALLERCKPYFSGAEFEEIARFVETHRDDVMSLQLARLYLIEGAVSADLDR